MEQNNNNSEKPVSVFLYDIWTLVVYVGLYVYIYKNGFGNLTQMPHSIETITGLVYRFFAITSISLVFFMLYISFFTCKANGTMICYNIPLSSLIFAAVLYDHRDGPGFVTNAMVQKALYPGSCCAFFLLYICLFIFYIRKRLRYTKKLLCEALKYYKNDTQKFLFTGFMFFLIIFGLAIITHELENHVKTNLKDTILRYIFYYWSLMSFMMTSRILVCSMINYKMQDKDNFTSSIDDVLISAGRILFSAFIYPIRYIGCAFRQRKIGLHTNLFVRCCLNVNNVITIILEVVTFGMISKKQEFGLQCTFYYKTTVLGGIKESFRMISDKNTSHNYSSNVVWVVCAPFFGIFGYFTALQLSSDALFSAYKNTFFFISMAYYIVLTEFASYSCNALLFYYANDQMKFHEFNNNLQNVFISNYVPEEKSDVVHLTDNDVDATCEGL